MTQNTEQSVRTRDEQVEALAKRLRVGFKNGIVSRSMADGYIKEAEARGAEEQRRKDAEGQEPVAWRYEIKRMGYWVSREVGYGPRVWEWYWDGEKPDITHPDYRNVSPLYDRPANVAALEAEIASLKEAEQLARADGEASKAREEGLVTALKAADQFITNGVEFGFIRMPDIDTPDSALATPGIIRAALTREGGV
ncbi:hypothetical protein [Gluconobacter cerinus]|uniref:Uncharacterized protein n=1 Tax=Gluconobacter cerinus TaxID=38307 RepID=A0A1B6VKI7_9PROT|nr:hypothetical protein [Gluconobacter cerinus]OAJ67735.1 hypothetical protein A0123_01777 [Gluconobacter cerinus]